MTQAARETILWHIDRFIQDKSIREEYREEAQKLKNIIEYNKITNKHFEDIMFEDYDTGIKILEECGYINPNTFSGQFKIYVKGLSSGVC